MKEQSSFRIRCLFAAALAAAALLLYSPAGGHPFILLDDNAYVTDNPQVRSGLSWKSTAWAFTTTHTGNWHPLTWLSHMADVSLFGLDAGWHHRVNTGLHALNTVMLFLLFSRMTGELWRSGIVAALFAVHPLHVESVAWVAERKDLLCALFLLLSMMAYVEYAERGSRRRYIASLAFFLLALLSKPMAVTLPFVLLLLDVWPLCRAGGVYDDDRAQRRPLRALLTEKAPYLLLTLLFSAVTLFVQRRENVVPLGSFPASERIANAATSYLGYLWKTAWPVKLSVFYPRPIAADTAVSHWQVFGALFALSAATALVLVQVRRRPYLSIGWLWYLGTLLPVIGLVQVGGQSMADRYTYIPLIGIFFAVVWGCADATAGWRFRRVVLGTTAAAVVTACGVGAFIQLSYWRNSTSLFIHALEVTRNNWLIHNNLGMCLEREGRQEEAMFHYRQAMRIAPGFDLPRFNLAVILTGQRSFPEAVALYKDVLRIRPDNEIAHNNLGSILFTAGDLDEAAAHYREAIRIAPDYDLPRFNLGNVLQLQGRIGEAITSYQQALKINPGYAEARAQLEHLLAGQGDTGLGETQPEPVPPSAHPRGGGATRAGR